jgi:hypothetical protein
MSAATRVTADLVAFGSAAVRSSMSVSNTQQAAATESNDAYETLPRANLSHLCAKYKKEIDSRIDAIDVSEIFRWFRVDLSEHDRTNKLKHGVGFNMGHLGDLSLKDRMMELNGILSDLQTQTVRTCPHFHTICCSALGFHDLTAYCGSLHGL